MTLAIRHEGDRAVLTIRLTPRAKADQLAGVVEVDNGKMALSIRVAAPPVDGAANQALVAFLAKRLGVARSAIEILSGDKSRLKSVRVTGASGEALSSLFTDLRAAGRPPRQ